MRTTVELDQDTSSAVERFRRETGAGTSEAVNELIRRGLMPREKRSRFVQETRPLGLKIDVSDVAEAIEVLEGPEAR